MSGLSLAAVAVDMDLDGGAVVAVRAVAFMLNGPAFVDTDVFCVVPSTAFALVDNIPTRRASDRDTLLALLNCTGTRLDI